MRVLSRAAALSLALPLLAGVLAASPPRAIAQQSQPDLALALSMNLAGGGPDRYSTNKLVVALFGKHSVAELGRIRKRFGIRRAASFVHVADYAVPRAMEIVQSNNLTIPDNPSPPPNDPKALATALYRAGSNPAGQFEADTLFDRLLSPAIYGQLQRDIAAKYPHGMDDFRPVLTLVMMDLKNVYRL